MEQAKKHTSDSVASHTSTAGNSIEQNWNSVIEKIKEAKDNFPSDGMDEQFHKGVKQGMDLSIFIIKQLKNQ